MIILRTKKTFETLFKIFNYIYLKIEIPQRLFEVNEYSLKISSALK
jgi:hypothetical protein